MKIADLLTHPRTLGTLFAASFVAYGWVFTTFVSAADFQQHIQTYELDRTDDKIDDLEVQIFNLKEIIRVPESNTMERREQLSKYEGSLKDYRRQQECLEDGKTNCRRKR